MRSKTLDDIELVHISFSQARQRTFLRSCARAAMLKHMRDEYALQMADAIDSRLSLNAATKQV